MIECEQPRWHGIAVRVSVGVAIAKMEMAPRFAVTVLNVDEMERCYIVCGCKKGRPCEVQS
jgi:hypothetical protein